MQQISGNNIVALLKDKEGKYRKLTYRFVGPPMNMMLNGSSSDLTADIAMMEDAEWKAIDFNLKYIYFVKDGRLYNYREGAGINACEYAKILFDGRKLLWTKWSLECYYEWFDRWRLQECAFRGDLE